MRSSSKSSHPKRAAGTSIIALLSLTIGGASGIVYEDGQTHSITTSLNEAITLRSSSKLTLPATIGDNGDNGDNDGKYTVRSPAGSDGAIRLFMSSSLNATGGEVIGADASEDHPAAGAGVIVGGASKAEFYDGVTVRGGNHLGATNYDYEQYYLTADSDSTRNANANEAETITITTTNFNRDDASSGQGGDAIIAQYYNSNATIHGGTFFAGKGSVRDGHSLRSSYEATITVSGGNFYGSWMANDKGIILVEGCVSRIGTRLVGRLENGHSLDVQVFEEKGGKIVVNTGDGVDDKGCNGYNHRKHSSSSGIRTRGGVGSFCCSLLGVVVLCFGFSIV